MKSCVIDIESEGLEPWRDKITCIGMRDVEINRFITFFDEDEEQIIKNFIKYYTERKLDAVIGYNVHFDIRFIFAKCLKYKIKANNFFNSHIIDVMKVMQNLGKYGGFNRPGKLDEWVDYVLGQKKVGLPYSCREMMKRGLVTDIINYNKWDVELTYQLWKRIGEVLHEM